MSIKNLALWHWLNNSTVSRTAAKYRQAVVKSEDKQKYFDNLTTQAGPEYTLQWTKAIEAAEKNRTGKNAKSMDIMAMQEAKPKGRADVHYGINEKYPSMTADTGYIVDGLKLEEEQYVAFVTCL